MKTMLKVAGGIIIAVIILVIALVVLIGAGAHQVQKNSDKHAITTAQYHHIRAGMTRAQVRRVIGDVPAASADDLSVDESQFGGSKHGGQKCVYYNLRGHIASLFQLCYDNGSGKLASKASY